jgi:hypothetical protein
MTGFEDGSHQSQVHYGGGLRGIGRGRIALCLLIEQGASQGALAYLSKGGEVRPVVRRLHGGGPGGVVRLAQPQ